MDAISLIQSIIPLLLAIIFSMISIPSLEELVLKKTKSVLAPVWTLLASLFWFFFAIITVYVATLDYFAAFSYVYIGIGFIFMALFVTAIILNLHLSTNEKSSYENEMRLE